MDRPKEMTFLSAGTITSAEHKFVVVHSTMSRLQRRIYDHLMNVCDGAQY